MLDAARVEADMHGAEVVTAFLVGILIGTTLGKVTLPGLVEHAVPFLRRHHGRR